MGNFQYKTSSGGSWTDVPLSAYHGSYEGTYELIYPQPQAVTGMGRPCAAIGLPKIKLSSTLMTASGMSFWQGKFASDSSLDAEFWLTVRNARNDTWEKYTGWLLRPSYNRIQIGTGSLNTMYSDVEITIDLVVSTT